MRFPVLAVAGLLVSIQGCRTQTASQVKAEDIPTVVSENFDIAALPNSRWHGESGGGGYEIKADLSVAADGSGSLTVLVNGTPQSQKFNSIKPSTAAEVESYRTRVARTQPDARLQDIEVTRAITLLDDSGGLLSMLPILHANELFLHPMGVLTRVTP